MGPCSSKSKGGVGAAAPIVPAGSQYNLSAATAANQNQLKYFTTGKTYENIGDFPKAVECFNMAIKNNPNSSMSFTGLGNCYIKMGDFPRAIDTYNRAVTLDPGNKFAYNGLGVAYDTMKHDALAIQNFNKAIQLDQLFAYPYNGLGNHFYARQQFAQAIPYYQSALRLHQNHPLILANLACCQLNNGQPELGFHTFRNAVTAAHANGPNMSATNKFYLTQRLTQFQNSLSKADPKYLNEFRVLSNQIMGVVPV